MDDSEEMMRAGCARRNPQRLQTGGGYSRGGRVALAGYMSGGMVADQSLRQETGAALTRAEAMARAAAARGVKPAR